MKGRRCIVSKSGIYPKFIAKSSDGKFYPSVSEAHVFQSHKEALAAIKEVSIEREWLNRTGLLIVDLVFKEGD